MRHVAGRWFAVAVAMASMAAASSARAQSTTLYLNSQPGDYIGQGVQATYTTADGPFTSSGNGSQVSVQFHTPSYSHFWYADFAAPTGTPLIVGGYDGATRYPFQSPSKPGLSISGDGRGCNTLTGHFVVREAAYDAQGRVQRFAADFEQHCEGGTAALFGSIRFNSSVPIELTVSLGNVFVLEGDSGTTTAELTVFLSAPAASPVSVSYATQDGTALAGSDYLSISGTVSFAAGQVAVVIPLTIFGDTSIEPDKVFSVVLSSPSGAAIGSGQGIVTIVNDDGPRSLLVLNSQPGDYIGQGLQRTFTSLDGTFTAQPIGAQGVGVTFQSDEQWRMQFVGPQGMPFGTGGYTGATRYPFQSPTGNGLNVDGDGRGCNTLTGRFVVLEVAYDGQSNVVAFAADFEQHCEGGIPALFGSIRFNSTVPIGRTVSLGNVSVLEGDNGSTAAGITAFLSSPPTAPVSVSYATEDGTALAGNDYQAKSGTANFAAGQVNAVIPLTILGDTLIEPSKTFSVVLSNPNGAAIGAGRGIVTIADDDGPRSLLVLNSQAGDYIGQGVQRTFTGIDGTFTAQRIGAQGIRVVFQSDQQWRTEFAGPQGTPFDLGGYSGATRFPFQSPTGNGLNVDGEGRGCNTLAGRFVVLEATYDVVGNVLAFAADFEQHCEGMAAALFGSVRFNSAVPIRQTVSLGSVSVLEGDSGTTAAGITVFLSTPATSPVSVSYATQDGTALAGGDYQATSGAVSFAIGQVEAVIPLTILGDPLIEPNETFSVMLSNPIGVVIGAGEGIVTITNDEGPRSLLRLNSQPGDYIGGGIQQTFTEIDGTFTAQLFNANAVNIDFRGSDTWDTVFAAPGGVRVTPGSYEGAARWPFQTAGQPGLSVSGQARGCNNLNGRFVVLEATYSGTTVQTFAANFEQHCEGQTPALYGAVRFNSGVGPSADLRLSLFAGGTVLAGGVASMVVTVTNNGPDMVSGATVNLTTLPALGDVNWACSGSGGASCPASGSGALPALTIPVRGTATLTIQGQVPSNAQGSLSVTALTAVPAGVIEWNAANDSASGSFQIIPGADLSVTNSDGQATAIPGRVVTYTIVAANAGPGGAIGATVADTPPGALTGVTWTCAGSGGGTCAASGSGSINALVNLPGGGSVTYTLMGTISPTATGSVSNTATVTAPITVVDSAPGNNTATDVDTLTPRADLSITQTDGQATAVPGEPVTYTITASNAGPSAAPGATLADAPPAPLAGVTWTCVGSGGGTCAASGTDAINDPVSLPAGASVTYLLTGTVSPSATGNLINTAVVTAPGGVTDPDLANNVASDSDTLTPRADLAITKTDGQTTAVPGNSITYAITVSNAGPSVATGATMVDMLPVTINGATWTCAAAGGGTCAASGTGSISDTVNLPAGAIVVYTLSATVAANATSLTNTATVAVPVGTQDPDLSNNTATDTDQLPCGSETVVLADGRVTGSVIDAGATAWFGFSLKIGDSYSLEFKSVTADGTPPGPVTVFAGEDGCGTSSVVVTDTANRDPGAPGGGVRVSFTAKGTDPFFRARLASSAGSAIPFSFSLSDTTLYSPAWSTMGSFDTFYSFQNTTGALASGELVLLDTAGTVLSSTIVSIPAGQTLSTNTKALAIGRDQTGWARFTHDGPPGAVAAEAVIANFSISPAYVQPVKFQTVRESR